jgi:hypothetical protein
MFPIQGNVQDTPSNSCFASESNYFHISFILSIVKLDFPMDIKRESHSRGKIPVSSKTNLVHKNTFSLKAYTYKFA